VIRRELKNAASPGVYGKPANIMHKRVDRISEARFVSPALHTALQHHSRLYSRDQ
jgi:hypothetical protein